MLGRLLAELLNVGSCREEAEERVVAHCAHPLARLRESTGVHDLALDPRAGEVRRAGRRHGVGE